MTPHRYERITDLFDAARRLAPEQRRSFLDDSCHEDQSLRVDVERLLRSHDANADFLSTPVVASELRQLATDRLLRIDDELISAAGPWRLTRLIGEGAFARVYLGEQDSPIHRRVAVKVLREGSLSPQAIARMNAEGQALALFNHPNIVGALHAGQLEDGTRRPFFVMEFVEGEPITTHCRRSRLGLRGRVELFLQLCDAIQHAHVRGVLHRDLKPSNVLVANVDGRAIVKIVDFGVAKGIGDTRLSNASSPTVDGQPVGTMGYMSPEQFHGITDTRSDVYSLGVLLYELCTERLPVEVRGCSIVEAADRVRSSPIPRASTYSRACRGDPDVILATALEKDPARRYQSAGDLAADLRRYLECEPILARRPSLVYLARSFARRNRLSVALAAACIIFAIVGIAVVLMESSRARDAEDRWAERVHDAVQRELSTLEARAGTLEARSDVADAAMADAEELLRRRPREARFLDLAADAARQQSKIALERNDPALALEFGRKATHWRQEAVARQPSDAETRESLAIDYVLLGDACFALGRLDEMRRWFVHSAETTEALATRAPTKTNQTRLAWSYQRLAAAELQAGRIGEAMVEAERSLRLTDAILGEAPNDLSALGCARQTHMYMATLHQWREEKGPAARHSAIALELAERLYRIDSDNREHIFGLLHSWLTEGDRAADRRYARPYYERGYQLAVSRVQTDPHHEKFLRYAACFCFRRALCACDDQNIPAAVRWAKEGIGYTERIPDISAADLSGISSMYIEAREIFRSIGCIDDQLVCDERVRELCGRLAAFPDTACAWLRGCAEMLLTLGGEEDQTRALNLATKAAECAEVETPALLKTLARAHLATGNRVEALALMERAARLPAAEGTIREITEEISKLKETTAGEPSP